ncbi:hypothetical protein Tco_1007224, partial [Tanacetum coccineum]
FKQKLKKMDELNERDDSWSAPIVKLGNASDDEGSDDGEEFGSLMFKKKYKYKSQSVDSGNKPMGFGNGSVQMDKVNDEGVSSVGSNNNEPRNKHVDTEAIAVANTKHSTKQESASNRRQAKNVKQESAQARVGKSKYVKQESSSKRVPASNSCKQENGTAKESIKSRVGKEHRVDKQESISKKSISKTELKAESIKMEGRKRRIKEWRAAYKNRRAEGRSNAHASEAKSGGTGRTSNKNTSTQAVHIRGEEDEESGLFIIRSDSQTQIGLAHTVAFEDHGETMNFCYLLESFFEDLEDFNT